MIMLPRRSVSLLTSCLVGVLAAFLVGWLASPAAAQPGCSAPDGADGCWELDFADEFNGDQLDLNAWEPGWYVDTGYSRSVNNNENACYHTDQVSVGGGAMRIRLDPSTDPLCLDKDRDVAPYVGGLINSRKAMRDPDHPIQLTETYFLESRIKSPSDGQTLWNWPAFWTGGGNWPSNGEIDILEGLRGQAKFNYHYQCGDRHCQVGATPLPASTLDGDWHVYAAERRVAADADGGTATITYYLDGVEVGQVTENVTDSQHYVIFDYTSHESHGTTRTGLAMEVDWVRTWSLSDEQSLPPFECEADAGTLSWTDHDVEKYWVYRSVDGGETYSWLGKTLGGTTFVDPTPFVGAQYQVHYAGAPRKVCDVTAEPAVSVSPLRCEVDRNGGQATLTWTDHDVEKYWVYRSVDGGEIYSWLGKTLGGTTFVDAAPVAGASYQVHYAGTPRRVCDEAQQEAPFARSADVRLGSFWNPDGVIYGYNASWGVGSGGSLAQVSYHDDLVAPDVSISQLFSGGYAGNFVPRTFGAHIERMRALVDAGIIPLYATGVPKNSGAFNGVDHMRSLIAGEPAAVQAVQQWAYQLEQADLGPIIVRLGHEGDRSDRPWFGEPSLYRDWYRAFHDIAETPAPNFDGTNDFGGLDDVIWAWTPTAWGFSRGGPGNGGVVPLEQSRSNLVFPGLDYVDWIGSSGYDNPCAWEGRADDRYHSGSHEEVLARAAEWADTYAPGKPFILAEWGSEYTSDRYPRTRAEWLDTTLEMLQSDKPGMDQIGAIVYFDRAHVHGDQGEVCDWRLHKTSDRFPQPNQLWNSPANLAGNVSVSDYPDFGAYRDLVNTPGLMVPPGPPGPTPPPQPPAGAPTCSVTGTAQGVTVSWAGMPAGTNLQLRSATRWLQTIPTGTASPVQFTADDNSDTPYLLRYREAGVTNDVACGSAAMGAPTTAAAVVGLVGSLTADDLQVLSMMNDFFGPENVTIVDDDSIDAVVDVYLVSPSVSSGTAGTNAMLRSTDAAVVILKPWLGGMGRLNMFTEGDVANGATTVTGVVSDHEITNGFTESVTVTRGSGLSWGAPVPGGDTLAELSNGRASLVVFEPGVVQVNGFGVGCRAMFPSFNNDSTAQITPDGAQLFTQLLDFVSGDCTN